MEFHDSRSTQPLENNHKLQSRAQARDDRTGKRAHKQEIRRTDKVTTETETEVEEEKERKKNFFKLNENIFCNA